MESSEKRPATKPEAAAPAEEKKVEAPVDEVTLADFAHEMGPHHAAMANALRVKLGVKKHERETRKFSRADLEAGIAELTKDAEPTKDAK